MNRSFTLAMPILAALVYGHPCFAQFDFFKLDTVQIAKGDRLVVIGDNVPVMKKTDTLALLPKGTKVVVLDVFKNDSALWAKVEGDNIPDGWVEAEYLTKPGGLLGTRWRHADSGEILDFFSDGSLRAIPQLTQKPFKGNYVLQEGAGFAEGSMDVEIDGVFYGKNKGVWKYVVQEDELTLDVSGIVLKYVTMKPDPVVRTAFSVGKIAFDEQTVEKEAFRDRVDSEVEGSSKYTKTRTIKREIGYSFKVGVGGDAEAKIRATVLGSGAELTGRIRTSFEAELGQKWSDEITLAAEHTINLTKNPKVEVIWIDVYRTGSVEVTVDGKRHTVPFEFPVATRTVIKAAK